MPEDPIWKDKTFRFHSHDIRMCEKALQALFDLDLKKRFYEQVNLTVSALDYTVPVSAMHKK